MSNLKQLQNLIKASTGEEAKVIAVPTELIHFIGDAGKALLLAQLIYWSDKGGRRDGLIFKTYKEIYQETGIKEKTCKRYYDDFINMGFFYKTRKLAYGKVTVHFKIDMVKLSELIKTSWDNQNGQNVLTEMDKMSYSITENTTQITNKDKNTTLSSNNGESEKSVNIENQTKVNDSTELENQDILIDSLNLKNCFDQKSQLPGGFEPSLENLYWSVSFFPNKSTKLATIKFIDYYINEAGNVKKTFSGWQAAWCSWMEKEHEVKGYDEEKLQQEHDDIKNQVLNLVCDFAADSHHYFLHPDSFYQVFGKEEYRFSKETINDCLKILESEGHLARLFRDYYRVVNVKNREKQEFEPGAIYHGWNAVNGALSNFIAENHLVNRKQLRLKFSKYCQDSINAYLEDGVKSGDLIHKQGWFFENRINLEDEDFNLENENFNLEDENFRNKLKSQLRELTLS